MPTTTNKTFLQSEALPLLQNLKADAEPNFGLMTPQHMVEHLIWVTKTTIGRKGEPEKEPTKSQLYFKKFIANGAIFEHRPKPGLTKADLPPLKYDSLQAAIKQVTPAIERFYQHFEDNPNAVCFNPMMGELTKADLEVFHAQHYRWHLHQFGLM